jgi:hypothetical protein
MKKIFIGLLLASALTGTTYATTYDVSAEGSCGYGVSELENTVAGCWSASQMVTFTEPVYELGGDFYVDITRSASLNDILPVSWTCGGGCSSTSANTTASYSGVSVSSGSLNIAAGSSANAAWISPGSAGAKTMTFLAGPSGSLSCGGGNFYCIPETPVQTDIYFNVTAGGGASVDLNIGHWIEEKVQNLLSLFSVDYALAQTGVITSTKPGTKAIIIANINLTNTRLIKVAEDNYNVSFVLTNRTEKQEGVQYRFSFINSKEEVVSTQTYKANLTLLKNTPVFVSEKLTLPEGLSGTYILRVQALTSSGLPVGAGVAGQVTLDGNNTPYLSSCTTNRKGYEQNLVLPVTCSVVSNTPLARYTQTNGGYVVVTKAFFGNEPVERVQTISEITNGKVTAQIRGLTTPGAYKLVSQVMTRNGIPSGKEITETFVVKGTSASILNLLLDKDFYTAREQAKATVAFATFNTNQNSRLYFVATLSGKGGDCAEAVRQEVNRRSAVELTFPITHRCADPSLSVKVTDEKGFVFAEKTLTLETKKAPLSNEAKTLVAVVGLAILFYVFRHEKVLTLIKKGVKKGKK